MLCERPVNVRENRMRLQGLKMQTNCACISPGKRPAEALFGAAGKEITRCGPGKGFRPFLSNLRRKPGEARGFNGGCKNPIERGYQQRRREGSRSMIKRLGFRAQIEGPAAEPPCEGIQKPPCSRILRLHSEKDAFKSHNIAGGKRHGRVHRRHPRPGMPGSFESRDGERSAGMHNDPPREIAAAADDLLSHFLNCGIRNAQPENPRIQLRAIPRNQRQGNQRQARSPTAANNNFTERNASRRKSSSQRSAPIAETDDGNIRRAAGRFTPSSWTHLS